MAIDDRKKTKKDTRSSITVQLSAACADFLAELLAEALDNAHRNEQANRTAAIQNILEPLRNAIELEEKKRTLRGQFNRQRTALETDENGEQDEKAL